MKTAPASKGRTNSGRLAVLLTAAWLCVPAAPRADTPPSVADAWHFEVLLDDKPIGYHDFVVRRTESGYQVEIDARFDVRILRIPVYTYRHTTTETWADGCLQRLDSRTDDNGSRFSVSARDTGRRITVETGEGTRTVDAPCVKSFAYWDRDLVTSDLLLNAQTGAIIPVRIEPVTITLPDERFGGVSVEAYRITDDEDSISIEIAYARGSGRWLYLQSRLDNGRTLRYLPGDAAAALSSGGGDAGDQS
jgi:hypothetical protein